MPVYELQGVSKSYALGGGQVHAVKELDLTIESGDAVAIVGPSGSGKTTLLQLLGGLDRPSTGSVRFEGRDMAAMGDGELSSLRLRTIGFVFQQFNLIPTLTAAQNVEVALAPAVQKAAERRETVRALLESVGLGERGVMCRANSPAASSSGWRSPEHSPMHRTCCSPTSRPAIWTRRPARRFSIFSCRCREWRAR